MQKVVIKKGVKIMKITVFLKGFKLYFERRTLYCCSKTRFAVFDSGAMSVCINDEKSMKKQSLNRCKIDGTSVQNQSSKKSCKKHEKTQKMDPEREAKSVKM